MLSGFLTVLLIILALLLLLLVVVLQQGNEGGIGSAFGSGNSTGFFGASGGVSLIVRATWISGVLFFITALSLAWVKTRQHFGVGREIENTLKELNVPRPGDVAPAPTGTAVPPGDFAVPPPTTAPKSADPVPAGSPAP